MSPLRYDGDETGVVARATEVLHDDFRVHGRASRALLMVSAPPRSTFPSVLVWSSALGTDIANNDYVNKYKDDFGTTIRSVQPTREDNRCPSRASCLLTKNSLETSVAGWRDMPWMMLVSVDLLRRLVADPATRTPVTRPR